MERNIAVVGCGYWGRNLVRNFAQLGALHTICDADPKTLEQLASNYPEVNTESDRYLVSYFLGVTAVGIYGAAYAIGGYASLVLAPLTTVLYPNISKTYGKGNLGETRNYLKYSVKYLMMITIPSALGLSVLAKPLLQILTTPEFISGYIIVPFVAAGTVLFAFRQVCNYVLYQFDKTYWSLTTLVTSAVLNVVLNLILIPRMGVLGAAIATLTAYGVLCLLTLLMTRRYLKFDLSLPFMAKSIFSSGIMVLCIWLINPQSIAMLIISIFAGVAVYFSVLLLIKGLSKEELAEKESLLPSLSMKQ